MIFFSIIDFLKDKADNIIFLLATNSMWSSLSTFNFPTIIFFYKKRLNNFLKQLATVSKLKQESVMYLLGTIFTDFVCRWTFTTAAWWMWDWLMFIIMKEHVTQCTGVAHWCVFKVSEDVASILKYFSNIKYSQLNKQHQSLNVKVKKSTNASGLWGCGLIRSDWQ